MAGVITGRRLNVDGLRLTLEDRPTMHVKGKTLNTGGYVDPGTVPAGKGKKKAHRAALAAAKRKKRKRNAGRFA